MRILNLKQGEPAWHAHRRWPTKNASDAPAALGESPYYSRSELLRRMATGITPEVDGPTQARFNDGHAVEALLRPVAVQHLVEPLHPFVGVADFDEHLSASFDGCTFVGDVTLECKLLNARLRNAFFDMETIAPEHRERSAAQCLPIDYRIQMEQQLRVAEAERCLFMTGELRDDGTLGDVFSCWYYPDDALWKRIQAGWAQFTQDLAAYVQPAAAAPTPTGHAPETLPALRIELMGQVTASNLAEFKSTALGAIRSVNRELTTDQHFADAKQAVKWCAEVETRIKAAKEHALSQTASIEELFRTLDDVSAEARRVRLDLEKLVTRREVEIKGELVAAAKGAYDRHEAECRQDAGAWKTLMPPDFGGAIKGKRSVDSMRDALDACLANAKIAASEQARKIRANLVALDEESKGSEHLFRDRLTFIDLTPEVVRLMVRQRIAEHRAAEEKRAAELVEKERERIRAEEQAKAEKEARDRQEAEDLLVGSFEAAARRIEHDSVPYIQKAIAAYESVAKDWESDPRPRVREAFLAGRAYLKDRMESAQVRQAAEAERPAQPTAAAPIASPAVSSPVKNVVPIQRPAPAVESTATIRLGQIGERLGFTLTADFLSTLGFHIVATEKGAKYYREADFDLICEALVAHVRTVQAKQQLAA